MSGPAGQASRGHRRGYGQTNLWERITFSYVRPLLDDASVHPLNEEDAGWICSHSEEAGVLASRFSAEYKHTKASRTSTRVSRSSSIWSSALAVTLLRLHWRAAIVQGLWTLGAIAQRIGSPVVLRQFLQWLQAYDKGRGTAPQWHGWLWAALLGACGFATCVSHHQLFWTGMRLGFVMRQQAIAAAAAKVLRLNTAAVGRMSTGFVVNLVSNDVRRFDDSVPYWTFAWAGPLELLLVFIMVGCELDWLSSLAGAATSLALIPLQSALVGYMGGLRQSTSKQTDARVRMAGEVIEGALAVKMFSWENPFSEALRHIRAREERYLRKTARIRALNFALGFCMTPVVAFMTFLVYTSRKGQLDVAKVFYCLSLLNLPKGYMGLFVYAIQTLTELGVSLRRMDRFLASREPPQQRQADPPHQQHSHQQHGQQQSEQPNSKRQQQSGDVELGPMAGGTRQAGAHPRGYVSMCGADFDWQWPFGEVDEEELEAPDSPRGGPPTLQGLRLEVAPGELLAVCGEVGCGKSSLLAALLGELQPLLQGRGHSPAQPQAGLPGSTTSSTSLAGRSSGGGSGRREASSGPVLVGSVAYSAQIPWIMAGTVRDNIVFGTAWDAAWYEEVLQACCLAADLAGLPAGDATELGERGVNLSGGQKARISLARVCYARPAIALLDDPLSAVDPRVGWELFRRAIGPGGLLDSCGTTRILATHQRQYLPQCGRVLVLRRGRAAALGPWQQVAALQLPELTAGYGGAPEAAVLEPDATNKGALAGETPFLGEDGREGLKAAGRQSDACDVSSDPPPQAAAAVDGVQRGRESAAGGRHKQAEEGVLDGEAEARIEVKSSKHGSKRKDEKRPLLGQQPTSSTPPEKPPTCNDAEAGDAEEGEEKGTGSDGVRSGMFGKIRSLAGALVPGGKREYDSMPSARKAAEGSDAATAGSLVADEERETGSVSWAVYADYCRHQGLPVVALVAAAMVAGQAVFILSDYWLGLWAKADEADQRAARWLTVYGVLTLVVIALSAARSLSFFGAALTAATSLHNAMAARVLRAPLHFFHTNPTGRIVNRFSKDQGHVDDLLPQTLFDALQAGFQVAGALLLVAAAVPLVLPAFVPLALAFLHIRNRYIAASRDVKRWEAVTRSPVYASFSAMLKGLPTIRAYGAAQQQRFYDMFLEKLNANGAWYFAFICISQGWVGVRMDAVSACVLLCAALLAVAMHRRVASQVLALALTQTLQLMSVMQWFVRQSAEVENHMTSVERMLAYTQLESEPPRVEEGAPAPPPGWPRSGALRYEDVTAVYRPGLAPVLSNITFNVPAGSSCGLVGRTGSGKSSLVLTLFRLIPVTHGSIYLDGLDTASIGLDALRRQLSVIPQDPVLFSGTLRRNLDPWGTRTDPQLWRALETVQLKTQVASAPGGLDARLAECGDNLSAGQRQLFCLARALLQDARVLALDEATANVDRATDAIIQSALRRFLREDGGGGAGCGGGSSSSGGAGHGGGGGSSACGGQVGGSRGRVLLVIAHRLDTVMECDAVVVLAAGRMVERGAPGELARAPGGVFAGMLAAA